MAANGGNVSCLTCHDALLQMQDDFSAKWVSPNFLRGVVCKTKTDFCFICHPRNSSRKPIPTSCSTARENLICKTVLSVTIPCLTRRGKEAPASSCSRIRSRQCASAAIRRTLQATGLIPGQPQVSADMRKALEERERAQQLELPLLHDRIMCGTCHNPHEKGVMQAAAVQSGAGRKYFLRMNGGYELCVACHDEKKVKDRRRQALQVLQESFQVAAGSPAVT